MPTNDVADDLVIAQAFDTIIEALQVAQAILRLLEDKISQNHNQGAMALAAILYHQLVSVDTLATSLKSDSRLLSLIRQSSVVADDLCDPVPSTKG